MFNDTKPCVNCGKLIEYNTDHILCPSCVNVPEGIPQHNRLICPECGDLVDGECTKCGEYFGRRGWRTLGTYDG